MYTTKGSKDRILLGIHGYIKFKRKGANETIKANEKSFTVLGHKLTQTEISLKKRKHSTMLFFR